MSEITDLKLMSMEAYCHLRELLSRYISRNSGFHSMYDQINEFDHNEIYALWDDESKKAYIKNDKNELLTLDHGCWVIINKNKFK